MAPSYPHSIDLSAAMEKRCPPTPILGLSYHPLKVQGIYFSITYFFNFLYQGQKILVSMIKQLIMHLNFFLIKIRYTSVREKHMTQEQSEMDIIKLKQLQENTTEFIIFSNTRQNHPLSYQ